MRHTFSRDIRTKSFLLPVVVMLALSLILYLRVWHSELRNNLVRVSLLHNPVEDAYPYTLDIASQVPSVARMVGRLHLRAERPDVALYWLQRATSGMQAPLAYFDLCAYYWESHREQQALTACRAGHVPAQYWRSEGARAEVAHDPDTAMRAYKMAITLDPDLIDARLRLADLWEKQQRPYEVIRLLEQWVNHPKFSPGQYRLLSSAYGKLGQSDRAVRVLLEGSRRFPDSAVIQLFIAYAYSDRGEIDLAAPWYDLYLQQQPNTVYVLGQRARIAEAQKDWDLAASLYERAAALSPSDTGLWLGLGRSREAAGQTVAAVAAYERVLQLDPGNEYARKRIQALR